MRPLVDKYGLAEFLSISVGWVERATAARELPITPVGKSIRYDLDDIAAWLAIKKEWPKGASLRTASPAVPPLHLVTGPRPPAGPLTPPPPAGPVSPGKARRSA